MILQAICEHFDLPSIQSSQPLVSGLINNSYKVNSNNGNSYFLQRINTSIFTNPLSLQNNYQLIQHHLSAESGMKLPKLIKTKSGDLLYEKNNEVWRCFEFLKNTYSPHAVQTPEKAYEVANCFGAFTASLQSLDSSRVETILPRFHDLELRFDQFKTALQNASPERISGVRDLIEQVEHYATLVKWFQKISADKQAFPLHIMHHDCKISNILFDADTDVIRCPIDLDTTQTGLFFSDIGDMIRTIVSNKNEDATDIYDLHLRPDFFMAVTEGYMNAMSEFLTPEERKHIHYSGSLMIYMQALRFLADHLNGNIYYKTAYPEQNKDRTANQLQLLDLVQEYVMDKQHQSFKLKM